VGRKEAEGGPEWFVGCKVAVKGHNSGYRWLGTCLACYGSPLTRFRPFIGCLASGRCTVSESILTLVISLDLVMAAGRIRWILLTLCGALCLVAAWRYWPNSGAEIPQPADLGELDARLNEQIRLAIENVQSAPDSDRAWGELGMVYHGNGMPDLAIVCYSRAIQEESDDAHWHYYRAMAHVELGERQTALSELDDVIRLEGRFAPAHWRRGLILFDLGEFSEAEASFRQAIKCDGHDPAGWRGLARTLLQLDRNSEAVDLLQEWLGQSPQDRYARQLLGIAYRQSGQMARAEEELRDNTNAKPTWQDRWLFEVIQYGSNPGILIKEARFSLQRGEIDRAVSILSPLCERMPEDISVRNVLAQAYVQRRQFASALRLVEQSIRLQPGHYEAHLIRATVFLHQRKLSEAITAADQVIACHSGCADAYEVKALALDQAGKPELAIPLLLKADALDPQIPEYAYHASVIYSRAKRWKDAETILQTSYRRHPNYVPTIVGLATVKMEQGRFKEAEELIDRARRRDPANRSLDIAVRRLAKLKDGSK